MPPLKTPTTRRDAELFFAELVGEPPGAEAVGPWESVDEGRVFGRGRRGGRLSRDRRQAIIGQLISFRPSREVQQAAQDRGVRFLPIERARGKVLIDYYSIEIETMPNDPEGGSRMSPDALVERVRLRLDEFLDTELASYAPYESRDSSKWRSRDPVGAVLKVDLRGPDDGAVVCTRRHRDDGAGASNWIFSTARTERAGRHPMSGNRKVGIFRNPSGKLVFYSKGAHRRTTLLSAAANHLVLQRSNSLWDSFQSRVKSFVSENGGKAEKALTSAQWYKWDEIRGEHFNPGGSWI